MRKLLIAALLLSTSGANAGWFGPRNYRECVLNEMKGTAASMLPTVKGLCNKRFPCAEPTPGEYAECNNVSNTAERITVPTGWGRESELTLRFTPRDTCIDGVRKAACPGGNLD